MAVINQVRRWFYYVKLYKVYIFSSVEFKESSRYSDPVEYENMKISSYRELEVGGWKRLKVVDKIECRVFFLASYWFFHLREKRWHLKLIWYIKSSKMAASHCLLSLTLLNYFSIVFICKLNSFSERKNSVCVYVCSFLPPETLFFFSRVKYKIIWYDMKIYKDEEKKRKGLKLVSWQVSGWLGSTLVWTFAIAASLNCSLWLFGARSFGEMANSFIHSFIADLKS